MAVSLVKRCNAVAGHCVDALRVGLSALMARHASPGMAVPLAKRRNNAMGADKPTRRASTDYSTTALQPLTRETAIACRLRNRLWSLNMTISP